MVELPTFITRSAYVHELGSRTLSPEFGLPSRGTDCDSGVAVRRSASS
jgi:hypothetical protein